ncbi:Exportin 7 [Bonamia ostreae]|uniref:Exportin 7 n=1 Tax=Bonamia ostreae TaxID=126728 RepID=A0ABV2AS23_9EUKA
MMEITFRMLSGNYIPFGSFEFYKDNTLKEIVSSVVNLVLSIPIETIYSYPKMAAIHYSLIETLFEKHIALVCDFTEDIFNKIFVTVCDGVQSTNSNHSVKAANSLDHLCLYIIDNQSKTRKPDNFEKLLKQMESQIDRLMKLTSDVFQLVLFDNCNNQFSLTRTLCSVFVFKPVLLQFFAKALLEAQPTETANQLKDNFEQLVKFVQTGRVSGSMRDKFNRTVISIKMISADAAIVPVF